MAVLGFHFSGVYKESLYSGKKTATIMDGEHYFRPGEEVLIYLSGKPNLFDGKTEKRIGSATIKRTEIMKVKELTQKYAKLCGSNSVEELANSLRKWYNSTPDSTISIIEFDLRLDPTSC